MAISHMGVKRTGRKFDPSAKTIFSDDRANEMTLEEIGSIQNPRTQEAVLKRITPERKSELCKECEAKVLFFQDAICQTGQAAVGSNNFKVIGPYDQLKKYSHIFTVLAGWMTKEDLEAKGWNGVKEEVLV